MYTTQLKSPVADMPSALKRATLTLASAEAQVFLLFMYFFFVFVFVFFCLLPSAEAQVIFIYLMNRSFIRRVHVLHGCVRNVSCAVSSCVCAGC